MSDLDMQSLKALADLVRGTAPGLASLLTGPSAAIAVAALGRTLINDAQGPIADVVNAAHGTDPSVRLGIISADQACQLRLREGGITLAALQPDVATKVVDATVTISDQAYKDTADARARQMATHDTTNSVLAYATTAAFVAMVIVLVFFGKYVDAGVKDLLFTLLGVLGTGWAGVISYYFGSSAGSAQKTQAMTAALLQSSTPTQPVN
jgi:hypothetical protein